jgi:hypothetical protein
MRNLMIVSVLFVAACGGGSKKEETGPAGGEPPAGKMSPEAAAEGCLKMLQRQRECTDVFIPALVGWRVELDTPAGIAAMDASEGRDALVTKAKAEWGASNSDEQLEGLCANIIGGMPPDELAGGIELGQRCLATETCEAYTSCIEPAQRKRLEAEKSAATTAAD